MSETRQLLEEIAKDTGRQVSMVEPFIQELEKNWYDTRESLLSIDEKTFDSMNIPKRVQNLITQKLGQNQNQQPQQQQQQQQQPQIQQQNFQQQIQNTLQQQQQQIQQQAMQQQQIQQQGQINQQEEVHENQKTSTEVLINEVCREVDGIDNFISCMQMIYKILFNINENPLEEKFRILKKSNKKLHDTIFKYPSTAAIFEACNFDSNEETYHLQQNKIDQLNLHKIMQTIQISTEKVAKVRNFNAQQVYTNQSKQGLLEKSGVQSFYDQLEILKQKRNEVMSQPIKDRKIQCFKKSKEREIQQESNQVTDEGYQKVLKETILRMGEEEKGFSSRRQKEFENLVKQPCYAETIIRVRFVNDIILEAVFAPNETIQDLYKLVKENLEDPNLDFYIYDTPPMKIFKDKDFRKTFDEIDAVPGSYFFFGIKDESILQTKKYFLKPELLKQALN